MENVIISICNKENLKISNLFNSYLKRCLEGSIYERIIEIIFSD